MLLDLDLYSQYGPGFESRTSKIMLIRIRIHNSDVLFVPLFQCTYKYSGNFFAVKLSL
jgi:hypothetical protein